MFAVRSRGTNNFLATRKPYAAHREAIEGFASAARFDTWVDAHNARYGSCLFPSAWDILEVTYGLVWVSKNALGEDCSGLRYYSVTAGTGATWVADRAGATHFATRQEAIEALNARGKDQRYRKRDDGGTYGVKIVRFFKKVRQ